MTPWLQMAVGQAGAWPKEAWQGVDYHVSRLTSLGTAAQAMRDALAELPPAELIRDAYAADDAAAHQAFAALSRHPSAVMGPAQRLCRTMSDVLDEANAGGATRVNPPLDASLRAVCEHLLPPSRRPGDGVERLRSALSVATARHQSIGRGTPGYAHNLSILLMLTGLVHLARHPALQGYDLEHGPADERSLARDAASVLGLAALSGAARVGLRGVAGADAICVGLLGVSIGASALLAGPRPSRTLRHVEEASASEQSHLLRLEQA